MTALTLFPEQASTEAAHTDAIYFGLIGFSVVVTSIVVGCLLVFALRYRRGSAAQRGKLPEWIERDFEIGWTSAAFFLFTFAGFWTAATRLAALTPPRDAMEIHIVAKQWIWKTQSPERRSRDQSGRHSFVFRARVARQAGRAAGALCPRLVQRD